jgi:AraC-like DNA-binding protein
VHQLHAQALRGYRELVVELGGNPTRLLRKATINPASLNQLSAFISLEALIDLLELSATELDCPDFGLRLAERQDVGILGILAVALRYSSTIGEAMRCASKYLCVYNEAIAFTVDTTQRPGQAWLMFGVLPGHPRRWAQTADHGLGLAWRIVTTLSEGRCHLQQVWIPHSELMSESSYRARFDAPLVFRADHPALALANTDFDLAINESNQELHDLAARHLDVQLRRGPAAFSVQVRRAIEVLLGTGTSGHEEVARTLYVHPRTLQRHLHQEGTTFELVKDEVRRDLAERYLSQADVPISQVTALLDYSEPSALGRSCRRWFQTTPRALRTRFSSSSRLPSHP